MWIGMLSAALGAADLPPLLVMHDGSDVASPGDWRKRRSELLEVLLEHEYGTVPPPSPVTASERESPRMTEDGLFELTELKLATGPGGAIPITALACIPAEEEGPFPCIVQVGLQRPPIPEEMARRGYAYVSFKAVDLDPDVENYVGTGPAKEAYPDYTWRSLACWAWGASRVTDYVLTNFPQLDADRLIVTGHSRRGKAALLAGALDERFDMVNPNGSGAGGMALYRVREPGAETLAHLLESFPGWFAERLQDYSDRVEDLPFDQHGLAACVAPRPLLSTEAAEDAWANPKGTQANIEAIRPVYELLGVDDPPIAMHVRPGEHNQNAEDYRALMDYADRWLGGAGG